MKKRMKWALLWLILWTLCVGKSAEQAENVQGTGTVKSQESRNGFEGNENGAAEEESGLKLRSGGRGEAGQNAGSGMEGEENQDLGDWTEDRARQGFGSGTEGGSGQETGSGGESESKAGGENGRKAESGIEGGNKGKTGSEPEGESEGEAGSGTESESGGEPESGTESESGGEPGSGTESENGGEPESGTESESGQEPESGTEGESGGEPESEPESESGTEGESETEPESGTEGESETEPESGTEGESETEPESESESESGQETESGPESESEGERETEPESETSLTPEENLVVVDAVRLAYRDGSRMYDGTDTALLAADYQILGQGEVSLSVTGRAEKSGAGTWRVKAYYELSGPDAARFRLIVPDTELKLSISPKVLDVKIGDAKKEYFSEVGMQNLSYPAGQKPLIVSGFMKNGKETRQAPKGFEMPELSIDPSILKRDSPMYRNGKLIVYEDAIILKLDRNGGPSGTTTENYCYDLSEQSEHYEKGSITLTPKAVENYSIEIRSGKGFWAEDAYWLSKGSMLAAIPESGSGFNQGSISGALAGKGAFSFVLEKRGASGELLARSLPGSVSYQVDETPPDFKITCKGKGTFPRMKNGSLILEVGKVSDIGSGLQESMILIKKDQKEYLKKEELSGGTITLEEEGDYQIYASAKDQVGNLREYQSPVFTIDKTAPEIEVSGMESGETLRDPKPLTIRYQDLNLDQEQSKITLFRGKEKIASPDWQKQTKGTVTTIGIPAWQGLSDGTYELRMTAADLAGNESEERLFFKINRSGSSYHLSEDGISLLKNYYLQEAAELRIQETNLSRVDQQAVALVHNGILTILEQGRDYVVSERKTDQGHRYTYQIRKTCFAEEGDYTLSIHSRDQAGNQTNSREKGLEVQFFVDRTKPECFVTGVEDGESCLPGKRKLTVFSRDNGELEAVRLWEKETLLGETTEERWEVQWDLTVGERTLEAEVTDRAGNRSRITLCSVSVGEDASEGSMEGSGENGQGTEETHDRDPDKADNREKSLKEKTTSFWKRVLSRLGFPIRERDGKTTGEREKAENNSSGQKLERSGKEPILSQKQTDKGRTDPQDKEEIQKSQERRRKHQAAAAFVIGMAAFAGCAILLRRAKRPRKK